MIISKFIQDFDMWENFKNFKIISLISQIFTIKSFHMWNCFMIMMDQFSNSLSNYKKYLLNSNQNLDITKQLFQSKNRSKSCIMQSKFWFEFMKN